MDPDDVVGVEQMRFFPRLKMEKDSSGTIVPDGFHPTTGMGMKTMRSLVAWLMKTAGLGELKITLSAERRTFTILPFTLESQVKAPH